MRKFKEIALTNPDRKMTVFWLSQGSQIVLVGMERHQQVREYLADEEPFGETAPVYFSECGHYPSPIYQLKKLRDEVEGLLREQEMLNSAIWIVYATNNILMNKEDMKDDVWLHDRIIAFDKVLKLAPDFCVESAPEVRTGLEAFLYADLRTTWMDAEAPSADEDLEVSNEEEPIHADAADLERFDFNPDDFDLGDRLPFSDTEEPPYVPKLEDGLRAEAFPRLENPEEALREMIGCEDIKKQIEELEILTRYNKMRLDANPNAKTHAVSLHAIFQGAPGTGKTTLCKIYASLLYKAGVLSQGHVVVCTRSTFLGTNWGSEEGNLQLAIKAARGGVLMIDEAYLLYSTHPNDPGKNVLPLLMPLLADENERDIAVVLCGYKEPMENLMSLNDGLASRFSHKFDFPEFSVPQLLEISKRRVAAYNYHFTRQAWLQYGNMVAKAYENRDPKKWANAREVANLLEKIYIHHADRCWHQHLTDPQKQNAITVADIKPVELTIHTKKQRCIGFR